MFCLVQNLLKKRIMVETRKVLEQKCHLDLNLLDGFEVEDLVVDDVTGDGRDVDQVARI